MKQILNVQFPARLAVNSYTVISVVDKHGQPRAMRIKPGSEKKIWFDHVWRMDSGGRKVLLQSTDLTSMRENEGCVFLKEAYDKEEWPEGWALWESYLKAQHWDEENKVQRHRPVARGVFPVHLLPKSVQAMQGEAEKNRKPVWEAPDGAQHPDDAKPATSKKAGKAA